MTAFLRFQSIKIFVEGDGTDFEDALGFNLMSLMMD